MINQLPISAITTLIEESLDSVLIIDGDGCIRYLNASMAALCGYPAAELVGKPLSHLLEQGLATEHDAYLAHYIAASRSSAVLGRVRDFSIRHAGGEMVPIRMKALDLGNIGGVRYLGAFMEDMRARRALEAKHRQLLEQLEHQALTDTLTGLPNRRAFDNAAKSAMARARRTGETLTVGLADVDRFKSINDTYGHAAGDQVLQELGQVIRKAARESDVVARLGGEEIGLLFPETGPAQAAIVAERIRAAVQAHEVTTPDGKTIRMTLSIGLAELPATAGAFDPAVGSADAALYRAKHGGRNRIEIA